MATLDELPALIAEPNPLPSQIRAVSIVFILLPIMAGAARFWARSRVKARLGMDDWLIVPALILNLLAGVALYKDTLVGGLGSHMIPPLGSDGQFVYTDVYRQFVIWKFIVQICATLTIGCTKCSLLFLYRRIFTVTWFQIVVNIWIAIIVGWTISFTMGLVFQCTPVSAFWDHYEWLLTPYCFEQLKFYLAITVSDFVCDVIIVLLPIPLLWKLQLPVKTRLATVGIFFLGALVCAAGAVRLGFFFNTSLGSFDVTYNEAPVLYWTYIEGAVAIVGACLPVLRPLFTKVMGTGKTDKYASYGSGRRYNWLSAKSNKSHDQGSLGHLHSVEGGDESTTVGYATTIVARNDQSTKSTQDIQLNEIDEPKHGGIMAETTWKNTYNHKDGETK